MGASSTKFAAIVGKNGYNYSIAEESWLSNKIKEYNNKKYTITAIGIGAGKRCAIVCATGPYYAAAPQSFLNKLRKIPKKNIKKISFGPNDTWAIVMKGGWCYASCFYANDGPLSAINKHNGSIKYVSFGREKEQWIVGWGSNGWQGYGLNTIHKNLSGFLTGINNSEKTIKDVEIGYNSFVVTHENGWRYSVCENQAEVKRWMNAQTKSINVVALW